MSSSNYRYKDSPYLPQESSSEAMIQTSGYASMPDQTHNIPRIDSTRARGQRGQLPPNQQQHQQDIYQPRQPGQYKHQPPPTQPQYQTQYQTRAIYANHSRQPPFPQQNQARYGQQQYAPQYIQAPAQPRYTRALESPAPVRTNVPPAMERQQTPTNNEITNPGSSNDLVFEDIKGKKPYAIFKRSPSKTIKNEPKKATNSYQHHNGSDDNLDLMPTLAMGFENSISKRLQRTNGELRITGEGYYFADDQNPPPDQYYNDPYYNDPYYREPYYNIQPPQLQPQVQQRPSSPLQRPPSMPRIHDVYFQDPNQGINITEPHSPVEVQQSNTNEDTLPYPEEVPVPTDHNKNQPQGEVDVLQKNLASEDGVTLRDNTTHSSKTTPKRQKPQEEFLQQEEFLKMNEKSLLLEPYNEPIEVKSEQKKKKKKNNIFKNVFKIDRKKKSEKQEVTSPSKRQVEQTPQVYQELELISSTDQLKSEKSKDSMKSNTSRPRILTRNAGNSSTSSFLRSEGNQLEEEYSSFEEDEDTDEPEEERVHGEEMVSLVDLVNSIPVLSTIFAVIDNSSSLTLQTKLLLKMLVIVAILYEVQSIIEIFTDWCS